jgi:hypothetical protein
VDILVTYQIRAFYESYYMDKCRKYHEVIKLIELKDWPFEPISTLNGGGPGGGPGIPN